MSNVNGLAIHENFVEFRRKWQLLALEEAGKWTDSTDTQMMLADVVLASLRREYENKTPAENMTYFIRAQACLIFSITGDSTESLKEYAERHMLIDSIPERSTIQRSEGYRRNHEKPSYDDKVSVRSLQLSEESDRSNTVSRKRRRREERAHYVSYSDYFGADTDVFIRNDEVDSVRPASPDRRDLMEELQPVSADSKEKLARDRQADSEAAPVSTPFEPVSDAAGSVRTETSASADSAAPVSQPASVPPQTPVRAAAAPAEKRSSDTYYDPDRTQFWTPGPIEETEHVVEEISIPDEEKTDNGSPRLSLINTFLFIAMIASFIFMVYESRVFQYFLL